jgi:hypothetical protein
MKKFLLIVVAAFAAANVSAANGVKKANFPRTQKTMVSPNAHLGILSKTVNASAMQTAVKPGAVKAIQKAPELTELIPSYSLGSGMYLGGLGYLSQNMYEGASFLVEDGKAYLAPFADLNMVEGVVEAGVQNMYSEFGADSITFTCSSIAELKATGEKLYLEPCSFDMENYVAVRMDGAKTFGAYYFSESNELVVEEILGLFHENPAETKPFADDFVIPYLDLLPKSTFDEYTSKAVVEWLSLANGASKTNDKALAVFGEDCIWIKGVDLGFNKEAWVQFDVNEADESLYVVESDQALGLAELTTDGQNYFPSLLSTIGVLHNNGSVTAPNSAENYISKYRWTDNADETSTLSITGNTVFSDFGYMMAPTGLTGGYLSHALFNVTITYESIVGIKEVKGNKQQNDAIYNIAGQRVAKDYKGLVIKNGKKYLVK